VETHKIKFLPSGKEITVKRGDTLYEAALALAIPLRAECGGQGTCGKCLVKIEAGNCSTTPHKKITREDEHKGYRLACQLKVTDDLVVYIPEESNVLSRDIDFETVILKEDEEKRENVLRGLKPRPVLESYSVELPPPTLEDNLDDCERLKRSLRKEGVGVDISFCLDVLRGLPTVLRGSDWKIDVSLFSKKEGAEVISARPSSAAKPVGLAIDLGTTTVAAELVDLQTGKCGYRAVGYNRQLSCGADIISRIVYTKKPGGKDRLRTLALETINNLLSRLLQKAGLTTDDVALAVIAGNTTMDHLLLGLEAEQIRLEPYIPAVNRYPILRSREIGLSINPSAPVCFAPAIGSYVGGDVLAGILACGMHRSKDLTLFIDAGTNGEIVLGNKEWMVGCACSTGPAFEGVGISCGMMAAPGAVEAVEVHDPESVPQIKTIAGAPARGICGSGMIDLMARLFLCGILDRKGIINEACGSPRVERRAGRTAYIVRRAGEQGAEREIYLNDIDFKKLLRTKAAIQAAIDSLLSYVQMDKESIRRVVIAGRLGEAINPANAIGIGMLPDIKLERFKYIGNGSLWGANLLLLSSEKMDEISRLADNITYLDLSTLPGYMDEFIASLFIPRTNV
jgi:uncharacterized 2Fe-2S/4Fe-4S cluster protein (DUF4445 family)